ncbi:hypothetical protein QJS10_CPA16g00450 [Acorus calamus]|uniref:Uncharacterized protein n=1 Tax=Acorus calamus TaxID=4465 RepID=A0AAV9D5M1_ACOCL|nr:hypothetical protein QJS10_CPA16g00450 [Acorus calamus]
MTEREGDGKRDEGEDRGEKKKRKREVKQGKMSEMMKVKQGHLWGFRSGLKLEVLGGAWSLDLE